MATAEGPTTTTTIEEDEEVSTSTSMSTLTLLEHINLNVPNQERSLPFYLDLLGFGLDPRRASNVAKGSGTVWPNCGASQMHLPFGEVPQVLPGSIGLVYDSLEPLKERLRALMLEPIDDPAAEASSSSLYLSDSSLGVDEASGREHVRLVDAYGNVFYAREAVALPPGTREGWEQPLVPPTTTMTTQTAETTTETDETTKDEDDRNVALRYGRERSECRGIEYVEFYVPTQTAAKIAQFYECVFDATVVVTPNAAGETVAMVAIGQVDPDTGRPDQSLLFREKLGYEVPKYDGHHIALYVGQDAADFEQAFRNCVEAGVVWINPRFSDKAGNLNGAKRWKQFRFKNIVDMATGRKIFELEHEVRSIENGAWPGKRKADD